MRYKREILMPYLENIKNLEMTLRALQTKEMRYKDLCNIEDKYINGHYDTDVHFNIRKKSWLFHTIKILAFCYDWYLPAVWWGMVVLEILLSVFAVHTGPLSGSWFNTAGKVLFIAVGILNVYVLIRIARIAMKTVKDEYEERSSKLRWRQKREEDTYRTYHENLPLHKEILLQCQNEIARITDVLDKVYAVDVIPPAYRNVYVASYLYTYLSARNTGNLDIIFQTLAFGSIQKQLCVIQKKLDRITANQNEITAQLSDICRRMEQVGKDGDQPLKELAGQEKNRQLQTKYLEMLEANTSAAAYFSAATCLEVMRL